MSPLAARPRSDTAIRHRLGQWLRYFPPALFASVVGLLAYALVDPLIHLRTAPNLLAAGMIAVYLGWLLAEVPVTFRKSSQPPTETRTILWYGIARLATATTAVLGPLPWSGWAWWMALPALVFVTGVLLRVVATRVLGRFYSHHVVRRPDHTVITTGPYRIVRHPAYVGMLLAHIGFVGFFANPLSIAMLVLLIAAVTLRIRVEERVMWTVPGYSNYAEGRARLLPGVW